MNFLATLLDDYIGGTRLFYLVSLLVHLLPSIAVSVRRLHDTNRSGWLYLLILTVMGLIPLLIFACTRSTPGRNHYGPEEGSDAGVSDVESSFPAALPGVAPHSATGSIAEIERLSALRQAGALTDAEFGQMKARVLGGAPSTGRIEPRF